MSHGYDLGEMIISDKENQAGPQGTGSQNESYFVKNRKMDAPEFVSDQKRAELHFQTAGQRDTGSGGGELRREWLQVTGGCNRELSCLGLGKWIPAWTRDAISSGEPCGPQGVMLALSRALCGSNSVLSSQRPEENEGALG